MISRPFCIWRHHFLHKNVNKYRVECHLCWTDSGPLESCVLEDTRLVPAWQEGTVSDAWRGHRYLPIPILFVANDLKDLKNIEGWQMAPCAHVLVTQHRQRRGGESKNELWRSVSEIGDFSRDRNHFARSLKIPLPPRSAQGVSLASSESTSHQTTPPQDGGLSHSLSLAGRRASQPPGMMYTVKRSLCLLSFPWRISPWGKFPLNADDLSEDSTNRRKLSKAN